MRFPRFRRARRSKPPTVDLTQVYGPGAEVRLTWGTGVITDLSLEDALSLYHQLGRAEQLTRARRYGRPMSHVPPPAPPPPPRSTQRHW